MELRQFHQLSQDERIKIFDKIVAKALEHYVLQVVQFKYFGEYSNVLYEVETNDTNKYMLKIANPGDHSREELSDGLQWLQSLHTLALIHAPKTLVNKEHQLLTEVQIPEISHINLCSITTWVKGRILETNDIDTEYVWKWGKLLAMIHKVSAKIPYDHYTHLKEWNKVFYWDKKELFDANYEKFFPVSRKKLFQEAIVQVQAGITRLYSSNQVKMILHGDLHNENIHVYEKELYAIDFEDVMIGYQIQDIAIALYYVREEPNYTELKKMFSKGYTSVLKYPETYEGEVELLQIGRLLMFANYILKLEDSTDEEIEKNLARYEKQITEFLEKRNEESE